MVTLSKISPPCVLFSLISVPSVWFRAVYRAYKSAGERTRCGCACRVVGLVTAELFYRIYHVILWTVSVRGCIYSSEAVSLADRRQFAHVNPLANSTSHLQPPPQLQC